MDQNYPVIFSVEYPDRALNRISTAFRLLAVIPIAVLALLLQAQEIPTSLAALGSLGSAALTGGGVIVIPTALMIVVRGKYPRWWYNWNLELLRFTNRMVVYIALMDDRYPSTDDQQSVRLQLPLPEEESLSRGMPIVKWLLAIPHYFVLAILFVLLPFVLVAAWVAILASGRYPRALFSYVEGVLRWVNRVTAYAYALVTDIYPPFSLSE